MDPLQTALDLARKLPRCAGINTDDLRPLSGVISLNNHVFRLQRGEDDYFLRVASEHGDSFGVRREEERAAMEAAAQRQVAPPLVLAEPGGHFVCRFIQGRHWTKEDFARPGNAQRLGEFLRALHGVPFAAGGSILARIHRMAEYAAARGIPMPAELGRHLETARRIFEETGDGEASLNHHDLWSNNFLDDGKRLWAVDWEFSGVGNGLHDLNTLLISAEYHERLRADFLRACGRDPRWVEERLARYQFIVHLFEGTWAAVQHGLRGSAEHGYEGMAKSHFGRLADF